MHTNCSSSPERLHDECNESLIGLVLECLLGVAPEP